MALYLIVVQAHFIMNNIFEGMIWFFLPASLVITNDIFAYICGITFGRTQLIKLSPKKTVEGFVGAWVLTIVFGFAMTNVLMRYKYFICPVNVCCSLLNAINYSQLCKLPILLRVSDHMRTNSYLPLRILAPTSSQASPALPTQSSSHTRINSPRWGFFRGLFTSRLCSSISSSSPPSPLSSRLLAASSPLV